MIVVGLGNPGEEYELSRHNLGRILVEGAAKKAGADFFESGKHQALVAKAGDTTYVLPETFMNKSGSSVKTFVTSEDAAAELVVVYDDLDLPFGKVRISFDRGSGGHNGVESIIASLGTKDFVRIRVGIAPTTPEGEIRKPNGEDGVADFVLGTMGKKEQEALPELAQQVSNALEVIRTEGSAAAMNRFN